MSEQLFEMEMLEHRKTKLLQRGIKQRFRTFEEMELEQYKKMTPLLLVLWVGIAIFGISVFLWIGVHVTL